jgi:glycosyltransferase involved in cell wall biosynthesis
MAVQRMFVSAGFDESRFSIVHHFVEVPSRPPSKVPEEGILYFGRFAREKGIGVLLRTAEILKNLEFILVGDGEMRQDIEEFCLSEHSRNVAMHPFTTGPQLEELILKAQLVVCPSQWEEVFGLTILESMALGKMVIASATGAIPEIIDDGENGFLVKQVTEPTEWARCITDVLKDPSRHSRIKLNAIETVRSRFSKDAHYVKLLAVYNSVVSPEGAIPG